MTKLPMNEDFIFFFPFPIISCFFAFESAAAEPNCRAISILQEEEGKGFDDDGEI